MLHRQKRVEGRCSNVHHSNSKIVTGTAGSGQLLLENSKAKVEAEENETRAVSFIPIDPLFRYPY